MPSILLATINARYHHPSFGLRYLLANMGDLRGRTALREFDLGQRPLAIAEQILELDPQLVGLGIYIWNVTLATEVAAILKRVRPELVLVVGGPEVSFETADQAIARMADHVITGEAELAFPALCRKVLGPAAAPVAVARPGGAPPPTPPPVIAAAIPDLAAVALPYDEYSAGDLAHRVIYVEASRGCPFGCEFCLSALAAGVRRFAADRFLAAMDRLLERGLLRFKFVDRTFNLETAAAAAILEFFLARYRPGLFLHFEVVPDHLPERLRGLLRKFPPGSLQLELGVQTFDAEVAARINRRQDNDRVAANLRFLRRETGAHLHADLIFGLPGESLESIGAGFDRLLALGPHEIQVGLLKRLRGAPIGRHDAAWDMVYSPLPPYEILGNRLLDFAAVRRLARFARFWDLVGNSGNFVGTTPLLWAGPGAAPASPFWRFLELSDFLYARLGRTANIALDRLAELVWEFLADRTAVGPGRAAAAVAADFRALGRRLPAGVRAAVEAGGPDGTGGTDGPDGTGGLGGEAGGPPRRQRRHRRE